MIVVRAGPEVVRAVLGLGRHGVQAHEAEAAVAPALIGAGAGVGRSGMDADHARREELDFHPAVDALLSELHRLRIGRRRNRVQHPARDLHPARAARSLRLRVRMRFRRAADGARVHVAHVREIHQVVVDELVVRVDEVAVLGPAPLRVVVPRMAHDRRGIGELGRAHPDPEQVVLLDHEVALDLRVGRHAVLPRHLDDRAGAVVHQAVVAALHVLADDPPVLERQAAMAAAVLDRGGLAVRRAKEEHRLAENRAPQQRAGLQLVGPGADVPGIPKETQRSLLLRSGRHPREAQRFQKMAESPERSQIQITQELQ